MASSLTGILLKNQDTEIGKRWNFKDISSVEEFRSSVPLTTYEDYKPYIDRIVNDGEQNLLTSDKVVQFAPSSGTTGTAKLVPIVQSSLERDVPPPKSGERMLLLLGSFPERVHFTPSGMLIEGISIGMVIRNLKLYPEAYVLPYDAYTHLPFDVAFYVQLVLGLKDRTVTYIQSVFISSLIKAITILKSHHVQMLSDIRTGTLDPSLPIPSDKRRVLEAAMSRADPERADQLEKIFQQAKENNYKEFLSIIWPNTKLVQCCCSGNMSSMVPTLKYYCAPKVPLIAVLYVCSEAGAIGVAAKPGIVTSLFHLLPHNFYEFIAQSDSSKSDPPTLLASEVEVGQVYELVLTLPTGFYRYRIGDFVKVIEQTDRGPLVDLYGRTKMVLHLQEHTLYEMSLELAMTALTSTTPSRVDYVVSIDTESGRTRYKVWIETEDTTINQQTDLDTFIDQQLQEVDSSYMEARKGRAIEQLAVAIVKPGTFSKILSFMASRTINTEAQLKIPRMLIHEEMVKIIEDK